MRRKAICVAFVVLVGQGCNCHPPILPLPDSGSGGGSGGGSSAGGGTGGATAGGAGGGTAGGAGSVDGGELECMAANNRHESGAACTFTSRCGAIDLACGEGAACVDGGVVLSGSCPSCLGSWCNDGGTLTCAPRGGTAVVGQTPLGPVDFRAAYGSYCFCFARDVIVQLGNTAMAEVSPGESLGFTIYNPEPPSDAGRPTWVRLVLDGGTAIAPAIVELEQIMNMNVRGTLTISAPGWSVSGSFDATLCPQLMRSGS